jgi:hypothetical protein
MPWLGVALGVRQSRAARSRSVAVGQQLSSLLLSRHRRHDPRAPGHRGRRSLWTPNVFARRRRSHFGGRRAGEGTRVTVIDRYVLGRFLRGRCV